MLNEYKFKSVFKHELSYFIKYKKSLGLKYKNEIIRLNYIDKILCEINIDKKIITKDFFLKLVNRNGMQGENYARQYGVTKDFCKYLIANNYRNIYYEEKKFHVINNYKPTIFNKEEITILFNTMDNYTTTFINTSYYQLYYTYSIVFRLIYACGLRISECLKIKLEDIDMNNNTIKILNSKRNTSRLIVISESMKICIITYLKFFNLNNEYLFINQKGNIISYSSLRNYYKKILLLANLNQKSRIHDLRHTFANESLNQMLNKGYDENVVIVYLYKYMGHCSIKETEYYLHNTNYNMNKIIECNLKLTEKIYSEVNINDEQ